MWVCADSHNGYISQFECYTGKKGDTAEAGLGRNVVIRLTRDLIGKNYHIYMDNFFSFVSLYKSLLLDKIYSTGTLRSNRRYFPPELKALVKKGMARTGKDWAVRQDGNTCVTVWQDTRPVASISTGHNPASTKVVTRGKGKNMKALDCGYNRFMGGVDRGDQLRQYYHVRVNREDGVMLVVCVHQHYNNYIIYIHVYCSCMCVQASENARDLKNYYNYRESGNYNYIHHN